MSHEADRAGDRLPRIEPMEFAPVGSLAGDFIAGTGGAGDLLEPREAPSAATATADVQRKARLRGADFHVSRESVRPRLESILSGEGEFVSTGQQPGLFLGPLYSLYKAVTAIRVAEQRERLTGRPTLALFWVAADDHDWDEVAACRVLCVDELLIELRVSSPVGREGRSVGETALPQEVRSAFERLRRATRGAVEGTPSAWLEKLREAYEPGVTFAGAFIRAMSGALGGLDIAFLDSSAPAVREAASELYGQIVRDPGLVTGAMAEGRSAVQQAGYEPALHPPASGLQIFVDGADGRHHVLAVDEGFELDAGTTIDTRDLDSRLRERPADFNPAAALRPVLESWLLPVAATVLGPGELSYWAQLPPLFAALDVPWPTVHPRDSWLLVEPAVDHLLVKLGLGAGEVADRGDGLAARWIDGARPPETAAALEAAAQRLRASFSGIGDAAARELPGLRCAVGKADHLAGKALAELEKTVDAHVAERESIALGQVERLKAHLRPGGERQERMIAAAQFLARYGTALPGALLAASRVAGAEGRG